MINTVNAIGVKIVENGGVHRYEKDAYDGRMRELRCKGAGACQFLSIWTKVI